MRVDAIRPVPARYWLPVVGAMAVHAVPWLMLNNAPAPVTPSVIAVSTNSIALLPTKTSASAAALPKPYITTYATTHIATHLKAVVPELPAAESLSHAKPVTNQPMATPVIDVREIFSDQIAGDSDAPAFVPGAVAPTGYLDATQVGRRPRAHQDLMPVYPQEAFARRAGGRVVVEILVSETGSIDALHALNATPGFADSALGALGTITFDPALLDGRPVASRMLVEIVYSVADDDTIRMF